MELLLFVVDGQRQGLFSRDVREVLSAVTVPPAVGAVRGSIHENLCRVKLSDHTGLIRLGVALDEALTNAMWHGNLECSSKLREGDGHEFDELLTKRRQVPPYCHRKVDVEATFSHAQATIVVRDEGPASTCRRFLTRPPPKTSSKPAAEACS